MPSIPHGEKLQRYVGDPWAQQPGESALQFSRFTLFLGMPRGDRDLAHVRETYGLTDSTVREVAERYRWRERAALLDADKDRRDLERIGDKESQLRVRAINLALVTASIMGRSLRALAQNQGFVIDPKELPQWAKMAETLRKIAVDAPDHVVQLRTSAEQGATASVPVFDGLNDQQARERAEGMARDMLRVLKGGKSA